MLNIKPLYDRVLIRRRTDENKTEGGIIIPDAAKEKAQTGEVVAIGQGRLVDGKIVALQVKAGDVVFFGKYSGTEAGDDLLIVREEEILGIIEQ